MRSLCDWSSDVCSSDLRRACSFLTIDGIDGTDAHSATTGRPARVGEEAIMSAVSRRDFLSTAGSFAVAAAAGTMGAHAAMGPNDKYDLVIKGGDVLDPHQSLRGKRDIGVPLGPIEALADNNPADKAARVLD